MCSKMRSESYGDDYSDLCPKKQKHINVRRRVPRRGPGVAELEKIRLEEQHNFTVAPLPSPPSTTTTERISPVYPFSSYFTTGSFPNDLIPPAPVFQRNHDSSLHYLPPMNLPNPGSGGFYQSIEPPSNQTSSLDENISQLLHEDKIVASKRPWRVRPTIAILRDAKQIKSLDQRLKIRFQDSGTTVRNPITTDSTSPATPIIPNSSLIQKEEFDHEFAPGVNLSSNRKPFYSFLPANEQSTRNQDLSFSLKPESYDTVTDHAIDLRLKL